MYTPVELQKSSEEDQPRTNDRLEAGYHAQSYSGLLQCYIQRLFLLCGYFRPSLHIISVIHSKHSNKSLSGKESNICYLILWLITYLEKDIHRILIEILGKVCVLLKTSGLEKKKKEKDITNAVNPTLCSP